jgi:uncharacterized protein
MTTSAIENVPVAHPFLRAEWRNLVMLNFEIDPAILQKIVPARTELDFWHGKAFVSVVGFQFLNTSVMGIPALFHRRFEEVNLRFYVRRGAPEGWRRGVVFIKEIVRKPLVTFIARTVYNESYITLPMRHEVYLPQGSGTGSLSYEWQTPGRWNRLAARTMGKSCLAPEDSEETFVTEHYWGYSTQRDGSTMEYQVEHPRWRVWRGVEPQFNCDVAALYGGEFAPALGRPPSSAFVAEGSAVVVRRGLRLQ